MNRSKVISTDQNLDQQIKSKINRSKFRSTDQKFGSKDRSTDQN